MPKDYSQTLNLLKQNITDDEMACILETDNPDLANRKILNCLIQKMKNREQMLDFCDQLEKVITSQDLKKITDEIKTGNLCVHIMYNAVYVPIIGCCTFTKYVKLCGMHSFLDPLDIL